MSRVLLEGENFEMMVKSCSVKKDSRLTFRVGSGLKKRLESIAAREGRSVAQISEAFLKAGSEVYAKEGANYIQRFLAQRRPKEKDQ